VFTPAPGFTLSVDYYNIKVKDRIGTSGTFVIDDAQRPTLQSLGLANYATVNEVQFLTNAFDTRTQGVDVVGSYRFATETMGIFNTTLAFNYNKTKVIARDPTIVSDVRVAQLEKTLPKTRLILTENWSSGPLSVLARMNWYGKYTQTDDGPVSQTFGSEFVFDFETSYEVNDNFTLSVGVQNLFSNYPDKYSNTKGTLGPVYASTGGRFTGDIYPDVSPFGFNGGFWYGKVGFKF